MFSLEQITILGPALVIGLFVALTHAPLGLEVLKRGIIFIDLAVAQIAALGFVLAQTQFHEASIWLTQGLALSFALAAGMIFRLVEARLPDYQEAIIGCSYVVAASLAVLLLSQQARGAEDIQNLLSGQMLLKWWDDVLLHAPIYLVITGLWLRFPRLHQGVAFYAIFAVAITSSVQLVGVYVVFASLILPALAAVNAKRPLLVAWLSGLGAVVLGIFIADICQFSAGPTIVVCNALLAIILTTIRSARR